MTTPRATKAAKPRPAKRKVLKDLVAFIRAMTTAPTVSAEEREEWNKLKQEFQKRTKDGQNKVA